MTSKLPSFLMPFPKVGMPRRIVGGTFKATHWHDHVLPSPPLSDGPCQISLDDPSLLRDLLTGSAADQYCVHPCNQVWPRSSFYRSFRAQFTTTVPSNVRISQWPSSYFSFQPFTRGTQKLEACISAERIFKRFGRMLRVGHCLQE